MFTYEGQTPITMDADLDIPGWLEQENRLHLDNLIRYFNVKTVIEVGGFLGLSTVFLARRVDTVYTVDPFKQPETDVETYNNVESAVREGHASRNFFGQWEQNVQRFGMRDRVCPYVGTTAQMAQQLPDEVDMVYLDGDHSWEGILTDLALLAPRAKYIICGDDFDDRFPDVQRIIPAIYPHHKRSGIFWWQTNPRQFITPASHYNVEEE